MKKRIFAPLIAASIVLAGCSQTSPVPAPTVTTTVTVTAAPEAVQQATWTPKPTEAPASRSDASETAGRIPSTPPEDEILDPLSVIRNTPDMPVGDYAMMDDDLTATIPVESTNPAKDNHADIVREAMKAALTGTSAAQQVDLIAVYSTDGMLLTTDRVPGGKWQQ